MQSQQMLAKAVPVLVAPCIARGRKANTARQRDQLRHRAATFSLPSRRRKDKDMSRTEEVALSRLATIATGEPPKLVETSVLRDLVADNRQPVHRMVAPVVQAVVGADKVVTGNDGPGWTNTPQVDQWRPP